MSAKPVNVFAPAKVNLYLHITGRLDNGYHTVDSLITFGDIGDDILVEPAETFGFEVTGPFASGFKDKDLDTSPQSGNLVVKAAYKLAELTGNDTALKITLTKNLPLGGGIGGGSADAAAALWGLLEYWGAAHDTDGLDELLISLGADVPVCFACQTLHVQGIGEVLNPVQHFAEMPAVLIHPGKHCSTPQIFADFGSQFGHDLSPPPLETIDDALHFLETAENMLTQAAIRNIPEIQNALNALESQSDCLLARMSGSGSSCFGIFETIESAEKSAAIIAQENPDWWVKSCWLGRTERY